MTPPPPVDRLERAERLAFPVSFSAVSAFAEDQYLERWDETGFPEPAPTLSWPEDAVFSQNGEFKIVGGPGAA